MNLLKSLSLALLLICHESHAVTYAEIKEASDPVSVDVLTTAVNPATGEEEASVVVVTNADTGRTTIIGLDQDPKKALLKANLALRLQFPEFLGLRFGLTIDDIVEAGLDIGYGIFFSNFGAYVNAYPFAHSERMNGFYAGARLQNELIFAIFGTAEGLRGEGVLGYKFDRKKGGFYSFLEAGVGGQIGPMTSTSFFDGSTSTGTTTDPFALPVIGFGIGWTLGKKSH